MPWHAGAHPELPFVELTLSGTLTPADLSHVVAGTLALASSRGRTRFLADCVGLEGGRRSSISILPRALLLRPTMPPR